VTVQAELKAGGPAARAVDGRPGDGDDQRYPGGDAARHRGRGRRDGGADGAARVPAARADLNIQERQDETLVARAGVAGPSEVEQCGQQRGLSSFGRAGLAAGRRFGRSILDVGYPYSSPPRITVGAGRLNPLMGVRRASACAGSVGSEIASAAECVSPTPVLGAAFTNVWVAASCSTIPSATA